MIQALQLILSLSFLVVIHELGHFTFARLFKVRVEKFYMFFNPSFSLFRAKKVGGKWCFRFFSPNVPSSAIEVKDELTGEVKKDEKGKTVYRPMTEQELQSLPEDDWRRYPDNTEWGIGWVPFGGYCAIAGMVDETKSATDLPSEPQPWEFRSKNVWQRLCIISGGILVNFIAALILFGHILYWWGDDTLPLRNIDSGLYYSELLQAEGFRQQDKIISIDGKEPQTLNEVVQWLIIEGKQDVLVERVTEAADAEVASIDTVALTMSSDLGNRYLAFQNDFDQREREKSRKDPTYVKSRFVLIGEYFPFVIDSVMPGSSAEAGGLNKGDRIMRVGEQPTGCYYEVQAALREHVCDSVKIEVSRDAESNETGLTVFVNDQGKIGCAVLSPLAFYTLEHRDYGFWESIPEGIAFGWKMLKNYVKQFRLIFSKEGAQSLGGFGAMGSMFPKIWDWQSFWFMTAFISLILAFMNFLPIPALDGGYILFLLVEILTGKQPSDKFLEIANNIGFALLLVLLILANGNDVLKYFF